LKFPDPLTELLPAGRIGDRLFKRTFGPTEASGANLEARGAKPGIGELEATVDLAQNLVGRQSAIIEL
jgi:hypothetical protein